MFYAEGVETLNHVHVQCPLGFRDIPKAGSRDKLQESNCDDQPDPGTTAGANHWCPSR